MTGKEALSNMVIHLNPNYAKSRQSLEDFRDIEKDLEVLEIIKKKPWILNEIVEAKDYQVYKSWCSIFRADINYRATETEFNLIKEWLER